MSDFCSQLSMIPEVSFYIPSFHRRIWNDDIQHLPFSRLLDLQQTRLPTDRGV